MGSWQKAVGNKTKGGDNFPALFVLGMSLDAQIRPQRFPFLGTDAADDEQIFDAVKLSVLGTIIDDSTRQLRADAGQFRKILQ